MQGHPPALAPQALRRHRPPSHYQVVPVVPVGLDPGQAHAREDEDALEEEVDPVDWAAPPAQAVLAAADLEFTQANRQSTAIGRRNDHSMKRASELNDRSSASDRPDRRPTTTMQPIGAGPRAV